MALKYVKIRRRRINGRRKSRVRAGPWLWIILALLFLFTAGVGMKLEQFAHNWEANHRIGGGH